MQLLNILTGEVVEGDVGSNYLVPILPPAEKPDSRTITEQAYIPVHVQIMEMMQGGQNLVNIRKARFDSDMLGKLADNDIPIDPTRHPGVDIADVFKAAIEVRASLEYAQLKENEKKQQEEAAAAAETRKNEVEALVQARLAEMSKANEK